MKRAYNNPVELQKMLIETQFVHKEIKENKEEGANEAWLKKQASEIKIIYEGTRIDNIRFTECSDISLSNEITLNYETSLRIYHSTDVENVIPRPWPSIKIDIDEVDLSQYNQVLVKAYIRAQGYQAFYVPFNVSSSCDMVATAMCVETNKWVDIVWEIEDLKREKLNVISINPWLMGCPSEALPSYELFIDSVTLRKVEADPTLGWSLEDNIAYSHVGYLKDAKKIAFTSKKFSKDFKVIDCNEKILLEKSVEEVHTDLGIFYVMDFSELNHCGDYQVLLDDTHKTEYFNISNQCYDMSIWKSMNFLRLLRCGEDIEGVHSACHLNCRTMHENGSNVPNFGGWHDAGDVSQFEIPTAEMAHAIIDMALFYKDKNKALYERLKEEARVGLNWLLRTRFEDGTRACAVTYSIWRKNILKPDNKTVYANKAENGPFENFCASAAEAKAYLLYKEEDEIFASWCLRAAEEDFEFASNGYEEGIHTVRWGSNCDSQVAGHGALAASELYRVTKKEHYLEMGVKYGQIICACQETSDLGWDKPLKGFFYEDPAHTKLLSYEHRGHEQSPIQGLVNLCQIMPNHKDYSLWMSAIKLYRSYVLDTIHYTAPYNLLPAHVYIKDKINLERFTFHTIRDKDLQIETIWNQAKEGIQLGEGVYLRIFPAAPDRRGFFATNLSKTKAVSLIAKLLNDTELKQICIHQLEWMFGMNPFASSTMFGEGHHYHPLYVAFSRQMVGALPVGIETKGNLDLPYWPTRDNSVYKEIWGHTTGKYLWVLTDILNENEVKQIENNDLEYTYDKNVNRYRYNIDKYIEYQYDCFGRRQNKIFVDRYNSTYINHHYTRNEKDLITDERIISNNSNTALHYLYKNDQCIGFDYLNNKGELTHYEYEKNDNNDVINIYKLDENQSDKSLIAHYEYSESGEVFVFDNLGNMNKSSNFIGNINPIRYKSYYYDSENEFYYLENKYYHPKKIKR